MAETFKGQLAVPVPMGGEQDVSDYRAVPRTDDGGYQDRGELGGYATNRGAPYAPPSDVKMFGGYGASETDLARGYCVPGITEDPAYDKTNYEDRYTLPREPNEDQSETNEMPTDWQFRNRQRVAKGFLTRPKLPTERN